MDFPSHSIVCLWQSEILAKLVSLSFAGNAVSQTLAKIWLYSFGLHRDALWRLTSNIVRVFAYFYSNSLLSFLSLNLLHDLISPTGTCLSKWTGRGKCINGGTTFHDRTKGLHAWLAGKSLLQLCDDNRAILWQHWNHKIVHRFCFDKDCYRQVCWGLVMRDGHHCARHASQDFQLNFLLKRLLLLACCALLRN